MPNKRRWGAGRAALLVADGATAERLVPDLEGVGLELKTVGSEASTLAALDSEPVIVALVSNALGSAAVAAIISRCSRRHPEVPVLVLGSTSTVDEAVDVMRRGAADYLPPPLEPQVLLLRLQRVVERLTVQPAEAATRNPEFPGLIGSSEAMHRVFTTIGKVSRYKTNLLLLGESGTGKELVARALHARGPRRQHLFVPLNCATLGRELLENELFGHERGAFTGANERKKGIFELADGGTLFLDEIAEMDPSTQAKLLRVLERNEFRRVGGTDKVKVDLSVIAATNRNLPRLIEAGKFREDLYYRLKVVTIVVPPLRERKEDIPALIDFFIADFNRRNEGKIKGISPTLLTRFMAHQWPGNVRELKNAIESAAILAQEQNLDDEPFESNAAPFSRAAPIAAAGAPATDLSTGGDLRLPIDLTLAEAEQRIIIAQVRRSASRDEAARKLGIGLRTLYTKLRQYQAGRA